MLRKLMLGAEPYVFGALSPLLNGKKARYARSLLAQKYCKGHGAEIGALMQPILQPLGSKTSYIDLKPKSHWTAFEAIEPDIIDDGTKLETVADNSFDYLIAAHMLEHVEDPISTLKTWVRVTKPGGHILVAVPDMRYCGEEHRELTSLEHFVRDHEDGPEWSRAGHFKEFGREVDQEDALMNVHFHTFTLSSFVQLLTATEYLGFELVEACFNVNEDIAVLRLVEEQK